MPPQRLCQPQCWQALGAGQFGQSNLVRSAVPPCVQVSHGEPQRLDKVLLATPGMTLEQGTAIFPFVQLQAVRPVVMSRTARHPPGAALLHMLEPTEDESNGWARHLVALHGEWPDPRRELGRYARDA